MKTKPFIKIRLEDNTIRSIYLDDIISIDEVNGGTITLVALKSEDMPLRTKMKKDEIENLKNTPML